MDRLLTCYDMPAINLGFSVAVQVDIAFSLVGSIRTNFIVDLSNITLDHLREIKTSMKGINLNYI